MDNKDFLKEMKRVLDGEETSFNSEVAKKVAELNVLADKYTINDSTDYENLQRNINKRIEDSGIKVVEDEKEREKMIKNNIEYYDNRITETKALNKLKEIFYLHDILIKRKEELINKINNLYEVISILEKVEDDDIKKMLKEFEKIKTSILE